MLASHVNTRAHIPTPAHGHAHSTDADASASASASDGYTAPASADPPYGYACST